MNEVEVYIKSVMRYIYAPQKERQRIEADLSSHFEEAVQAGEPAKAVIARMGSPLEVAEGFMSQMSLSFASFAQRLIAFLIDMLLIFLVGGIFAVLGVWLSNQVSPEPWGWEYVIGAAVIALVVGCALATLGVILLYFPILEARFGQTLGKRLVGLRVLKENGLPIGYKEAFLRRISYYFEVMPIDALFILFTARHQRAFDIVAQTIVVREMP